MKNYQLIFDALPFPCLLFESVENQFRIKDVNNNFFEVISENKRELIGKTFLEVFPENPEKLGISSHTLHASFTKVYRAGKPDKIKNLNYDLFNCDVGEYEERYWSIENVPLKQNEDDTLTSILCIMKDVTLDVLERDECRHLQTLLLDKSQKENHFIEKNTDGLFCLDMEGQFTSINEGIVKLAESPKEELLKTSFFPFCAVHHLERTTRYFEKAKQGENQEFEADFISANGRKFVLEISLAPALTMGKIIGVYGIARDITLLRSSESALEKNEKKFKALIQEGSDLMGILDMEGIYKFVSDTSIPILGIAPEDFIGKSAFDFIHIEDRKWVMAEFSALETKNQIELKPFRFKNFMQEWRWIETKATNLCHDPSVQGIVINSRDVTDRITSQQAIIESEERYRSFFENSPDAILITVPDGSILAANPSACTMFQRSEKEICKVGRSGLVDTTDPRLPEALKVRCETGKVNIELDFLRKDGTKFPGELTSAIFSNGEGRDLSSVIIRDISDKKKAEEELRRSREKYKFLFTFNPLPNWIFDNATLQILDVNEAAIEHYGFSRKEFLEMKVTDLRPEEEIPRLGHLLNYHQDEQKIIKFGNVIHRKKDLKTIEVEVTGYRFILDQKKCTLVVCQDVTERESILQKLKDREAKLHTAQKIARLGYWELNHQDNTFYWTKEVYKIWGRDAKVFSPSPETVLDTVHPEDVQELKKALELSLAGIQDLDAEHRIVLPDGAVKWIHKTGKLVKDNFGTPSRLEGTVQEITERKKNIQELMLSEARQANILRSQTNYLIRTDLSGTYTYCNPKFLADFQDLFQNKTMIGESAAMTVKEYHLDRVKEVFEKCLDNPDEVFHIEIDKKKKDGGVKHTLWDFICLTNAEGEPVEFQCVGTDITDRVQAEQLLKETNRRYELVTKATSDAIWDWHCDTDTLFWGEGFKTLFGYDPKVFVPVRKSWESKVHPEDAPKIIRNLNKVLKSNATTWQEEYRFKRADGNYADVIDKGFLIRDKNKKVIRMVGAMQDVTERKASMEKLILSEARYRSLVQSQTNYVIRVDMEGNYSYCNPKFFDDFSWIYGDNKILGKNTLGSIMDYHHKRVLDISEQCLAHPNQVFQVEIDKPAKDGGVRTTLWDFICITDNFGQPTEINCVGIDISDRVKAENEVKESNARYELVTRATSDAIWDWDLKTGKMYLGEGFQYLFGYNFKKSLTTIDNWAENVHSDDFFRVTDTIYAAIEGKTNKFSCTYRYKQANGEFAHVSDRALIVRDENSKAIRIVGAMQDITEKKQLEDLLEKASSLARIGSYEVDIATKKLYWSPMTKEIHQVEADFFPDFEGAFSFYKDNFYREKLETAFNNAVGRNISFEIEGKITTAKGNERWVRVMGDPEFEEGKCIRLSGSIQDVDKIKRAEMEVLKASEEKQVILESIGDAFFALDHDWNVTYWNQKAEEILKCPKENILGKKLGDVFQIGNTTFEKFFKKAILENSTQHFEAFFDGTKNWFEVNAYPSPKGLSIYFRDVTERKIANLQLLDLNKNLKQYTDELVTANKGLEQFSYIISHNLRAPVANIIGLADLLDEEHSEEIKTNLHKELRGSVQRLDNVIKDLNQILQVKNKVSEIKKPVRLNEIVSSIKSGLQNLINREQVKIITDFNEVEEFTTVRTYLYSIFYNLIFNSIKFRQPGVQPMIIIKSERKGGQIKLIFRDNGLGIDLHKKGDQLFRLYKRFHHHVEGKGMGLFMVKTQVEMLGGKINVTSAINTGTTFIIEFNDNDLNNIKNEETPQLHGR